MEVATTAIYPIVLGCLTLVTAGSMCVMRCWQRRVVALEQRVAALEMIRAAAPLPPVYVPMASASTPTPSAPPVPLPYYGYV